MSIEKIINYTKKITLIYRHPSVLDLTPRILPFKHRSKSAQIHSDRLAGRVRVESELVHSALSVRQRVDLRPGNTASTEHLPAMTHRPAFIIAFLSRGRQHASICYSARQETLAIRCGGGSQIAWVGPRSATPASTVRNLDWLAIRG